MTSVGRVVSFAAAAGLLAVPALAADGVLLVQKVTINGGAPQTHQIQIEAHRMRVESAANRGGSQVFIFDGTREVMLMIDDANKTYTEISKAELDVATNQVQEMTKNLPPEQRARIEALMKGHAMPGAAAAAPAPKVQFKKTGTDTVGKWTCDKYEGYTDGKKTQDLCTVDPKTLGFSVSDFAVTKDLAAFFQKLPMVGNTAEVFHIGTAEEQGFSGVPVRSVSTTASGSVTQEITDVHRQAFPDATFQAPAGYQKQASPLGGRGRRGGE